MGCVSFGAGTQGQLGNGELIDALAPTSVMLPPEHTCMSIVCGGNHTVCLAVDVSNHQQLYVWGVDHLSPRRTSSARELDSHGSTAELHQQAAEQQSSLSGSTADNGPDTSTASNSPVVCAIPTQVKLPEPGARVRRMAAGWAHTLLCTDAGNVWVAGDNSFGQLGLGQHVPATSSGLVQLQLYQYLQQEHLATKQGSVQHMEATLTSEPTRSWQQQWHVADVAAGMRHSLLLLQCNADQSRQQQPVTLPQMNAVVGFGSNRHHQLWISRKPAGSRSKHQPVRTAQPAASISGDSVCWCPQELGGIAEFVVSRLAAGGDRSACITMQGQLLLWGRALPGWTSDAAELGLDMLQDGADGNLPHYRVMPEPLAEANWLVFCRNAAFQRLSWQDICLGWRMVIALDSAGQVWTAGDNSLGQLGMSPRIQPQQSRDRSLHSQQSSSSKLHRVQLPAATMKIGAGAEHCAAVLQNGSIYTWGWSEHGQLGTGSTMDIQGPQQIAWTAWQAAGVACGSGFTIVWSPR